MNRERSTTPPSGESSASASPSEPPSPSPSEPPPPSASPSEPPPPSASASPSEPPSDPTQLDLQTIEAHRPAILRWLAWSNVPMGDVPDLAQEIVTQVWRTRSRFRSGRGTPAAWIRTFTRNITSEYMGTARMRREVPTDPAAGPWSDKAPGETTPDEAALAEQLRRACSEVLERTPEDEAAAREQLRHLRDMLSRLPPERAEVLVRHDGEGELMKDIAASLEIPESTGFSRLRVARAELAREIQREATLAQHRRETQAWQDTQTRSKDSKDPA